MTENEQIQEMARCLETHTCMSGFQAKIGARVLYSKNYRKVERGEWIEGGAYNVCSKCGGEVARYDDGGYYQDFALCPHCGADMRGEINER